MVSFVSTEGRPVGSLLARGSGCGGALLLHGGTVNPHGGALTGGADTGLL
ncbi:hypothetical protein ACFY2Q_18585 [Micromonospora sp. NPDC000316]